MTIELICLLVALLALFIALACLGLASGSLTRREEENTMPTAITVSHWLYRHDCALRPHIPLIERTVSLAQAAQMAHVREQAFAHRAPLRVLDRQFYAMTADEAVILVVERMGLN